VTGSRNGLSHNQALRAMELIASLPAGSVVVHGDARGADSQLADMARGAGLVVEDHPAEWDRLGRRAGPVRNVKMVDLGADTVWAFPDADSRGTWHCVALARMAGIPTEIVE